MGRVIILLNGLLGKINLIYTDIEFETWLSDVSDLGSIAFSLLQVYLTCSYYTKFSENIFDINANPKSVLTIFIYM